MFPRHISSLSLVLNYRQLFRLINLESRNTAEISQEKQQQNNNNNLTIIAKKKKEYGRIQDFRKGGPYV